MTVTAPEIIQPGERYDRANEIQHRETARRRDMLNWKRNAHLIVPVGILLGFAATNGNEYVFGVDENNALTFGIQGSSPVGLASIAYVTSVEAGLAGSFASSIAALTTAYQAADATIAASVTTETNARSTADLALASSITALTTAYQTADSTLQANITSEATARSSADSAEATTRAANDATLQTNINTVSASVTTETTARVTADGALASSITSLTTAYQSADTTLQSNITAEATARASADSTETTARTSADSTLQTNINTVTASVTTEATTRASADSALATRASALEASVDTPTTGLLARVTTVEAAYVAGDTAVAATVTSLTAVVAVKTTTFRQSGTPTATAIGDHWYNTGSGNALKVATAIGTGSWVATDNAQIATNTADISTVSTAVSTLSGSVATLSTTVSAHTSSLSGLTGDLSTLTSSVTSIAQAYATNSSGTARLIWEVAVGTNVASLVQTAASGYADGTWNGSAITLSATQINLNANVLVSGSLDVARISAGSIVASKLASGSIAAVGYATPTTGGITNSYASKASKAITTDGGPVEIEFAAFFELDNPLLPEWATGIDPANVQEITIMAKVKRDSTVLLPDHVICAWVKFFDGVNGFFDVTQAKQQGRVILVDEPTAGSYTYSIELKCSVDDAGTGNPATMISGGNLFRVLNPIDGPTDVSGP